jgi:transposase
MTQLELVKHLSLEEIGRRFRATREVVERAHWQVVWLVGQGRSGGEVARITGFSRTWVGAIVRRYNGDGPESLGDRRHRNAGAKPLLNEEDEVALRAALEKPPADGGLWTGAKVAAWLAVRTGGKVWPQRGWEALRRLGQSLQVPRPRHAKAASLDEQTAFKKPRRSVGRATGRAAGAAGRALGNG